MLSANGCVCRIALASCCSGATECGRLDSTTQLTTRHHRVVAMLMNASTNLTMLMNARNIFVACNNILKCRNTNSMMFVDASDCDYAIISNFMHTTYDPSNSDE